MRPLDIRIYKTELRQAARVRRASMPPTAKAAADKAVENNVRRLYQYRGATTIMVYVSTDIEINTRGIIENAWADGKKVAVPRCIPDTREMQFHYITSFDDLSPGTFSVLEPDESLPVVENFNGCLMLVPGFVYDRYGYRLGYGKGYYDRYISRFTGVTVGVCYEHEVTYRLQHGRYDRSVGTILTEKRIRKSVVYAAKRKNFGGYYER